ncbi:HEPN domain-containing protein [Spirillospora sp. NPDC048911]|uniref:HEPN domain-containing protein n=1 Tax=Spirillospora sp. NPDC048911 TaxID=3364527 RepID=UPI0037188840
MARWARGDAVVERLIGTGELQKVQGPAADGEPWLVKAQRTYASAVVLAESDRDSAYVLAYDAARLAGTALLAHQGLRPTTKGGHLVVDEVLRAQFGEVFRPFRGLRIRRNELEYPAFPGDSADESEVEKALAGADQIVRAAQKLLPRLGLF